MKKTLSLIFGFISFISLSLFCSFISHAEAAPDLSQHTYELINDGTELIFQTMGTEHGIFNTLGNYTDVIRDFLGIDPGLKPEDYSIRPLSDIEKENLEEGYISHFYDKNGNEIPLDSLYYVSADNGYFQAEFYMDSNGDILYTSSSDGHTLLNLGYGGFVPVTGQNFASWNDVYDSLVSRISNNNYNYSSPNVTLTDNSYFLWVPYGGSAGYVYIANQYNPNVTVPVTNTNGAEIKQWYTNDLSTIVFANTKGDISSQLQVSVGSWTKLGHIYKYRVTFMPSSGYASMALGSYQTWLNQGGNFIFGRVGYWYDGTRYQGSVPFVRTQESEMPLLVENELYSYDELSSINSLTNQDPEINPNYDPSSIIDPSNYPFQYPSPVNPIVPSDLPLAGSNPSINPLPEAAGDLSTIDPSGTFPDTIPIIDNLQYRFPFSIPWDIKKLLQGLRSTPEAPSFAFEWYIEPLDYTWYFDLDLSDFNSQASLFRTLFLISFIIGLAIFSYNHFFGS